MVVKDKIRKINWDDKEIEKKRREFMNAGGYVQSDLKSEEWIHINLRIRQDLVDKIDGIVKSKRIGMKRTGWILEAIQKYLNDEEK